MATIRGWFQAAILLTSISVISGCNRGGPDIILPDSPMVDVGKIKEGTGPSFSSTDNLTDPKEILNRVTKALYSVNSALTNYSIDVTYDLRGMQGHHQQLVTIYRINPQPEKVRRILMDQESGSHDYYVDGSNFTTYQRISNTYIRQECRGNITELARRLDEASPMILGTSSFLTNKVGINFLTNLKLNGKEVVKKRDCYVVDAKFLPSFLIELARRSRFQPGIVPITGSAKLWIDAQNYSLVKSIADIGVQVKDPKSMFTKVVHQIWTQSLHKLILNPVLDDNTFAFTPPPKAQEIFTQRETPTTPTTTDPFAVK
ncbi:MAG: DUF2092 domain-containing protein [Chthonomonadales bacterium]